MQSLQTKAGAAKAIAAATALAACTLAAPSHAGEWSANAAMTSNYIWRGLTQTTNEAAIQGGIDYADDSGFYFGTWVSNVNYGGGLGDPFSFEHDIYAGFGFETGDVAWDIGYLYYNYDEAAEFDFSEVYGSVSFGGFTLGANVLAHAEPDEGPDQDFGFGEAIYAYLDYGFVVGNDVEVGLHIGYHDGDFAEAFNGTLEGYYDYNITFAKGGFAFMISDTDLSGDMFATTSGLQNDDIRFTVSYAVDVEL